MSHCHTIEKYKRKFRLLGRYTDQPYRPVGDDFIGCKQQDMETAIAPIVYRLITEFVHGTVNFCFRKIIFDNASDAFHDFRIEDENAVSTGLVRRNLIMVKNTYEIHKGRILFVKEMIQ